MTESDNKIALHIDRPALMGDMAAEVVRQSLIIEGWAAATGGISAVEIGFDDDPPHLAHYGMKRSDIAETFPDWEAAGTSGFGLMVPAGTLGNGRHDVRITARAATGEVTEVAFSLIVDHSPASEGPGVLRRKVPLAEVELGERILEGLDWRPRFGLILGIGEIDEEVEAARLTLASLREQAYPKWHVCVVRRSRDIPDALETRLLDGFDDILDRISFDLNAAPDATLAGLASRPGPSELIGVLLAGDALGANALLATAITSGLHAEAEIFYCDEWRVTPVNDRWEAFFKPAWSPELLMATNYIGRFWCALPPVFNRAKATVGEWARYGDYDLILRCTEVASDIRRIPELLCARGRPRLDHPEQERAALRRAMGRQAISGELHDGFAEGYYRLTRNRRDDGLVSIVIPTCASRGLIETCLDTLRHKTAYRNFEIICVENIPDRNARWKSWLDRSADTVVSVDGPFNWSRFNNIGARHARGQFLLFLNDDTEIIDPGWLEALLEHAERPEIGAVGARLLYPDRTVQHAGLFWTPQGGRHAFRHTAADEPGYFGLSLSERNVIAVTGACLMVRRAEFEAIGGFDESHDIVNNDVDYCLRCWERGRRVVYTPYAILVHHELASRHGLDDHFDDIAFARRWRRKLGVRDEFYHPDLSLHRDDYAGDPEPIELIYSSRPLFDRAGIRDVLAVKLDHIGDFILAIPALRRLQEGFPQARLHLLTPPGSAAMAGFLPGLASVIEFTFFHERSGLGVLDLSEGELSGLRDRLAPYRFDLAVDFRKHPETRPILQLAGARWLAGFDHARMFPWLDIAVEWEQDPAAIRKGSHVSDDLLRLADCVADAARPAAHLTLATAPAAANASAAPHARGSPRLVCVHPGVGSAIRQWPAEYFAALIDLLLASHDLNIVLIGSRDEAGIADEVLSKLRHSGSARSLVGEVPLRELPALLASAALFIGNNSGPKHLAAGLGIPTVSIESGTVDAREWGPGGANAVGVRRNMMCSPCYLSVSARK